MSLSRHIPLAIAAAFAVSLLGGVARAGSIEVAPGASGQIDVGDRYSYTTIDIFNAGAAPGRLEIGARTVDVPANGKAEVYDRYGRSTVGGSYVTVTNRGSVPLRVISRYQMTYMTQ